MPTRTATDADGQPVYDREKVLEPMCAVARESEQVLQHLNARGFVPFHPTLAHHLGHKAALFLGLCLYWTRHGARNNPHRQGWVYLSSQEIAAATSLTRREQETVRNVLATAGLLEEQLVGRPAKMHYRLSLRRLANRLEIIDASTATPETAWAWFEKSVSYYRPLGDIAGSSAGGLYLSFVLRQQRKALLAGRSAEVMRFEPADVERTLCLSPKTQRNIRQRLVRLGILTMPLTSASMVRVNVSAILACLRGQDVKSLPSSRARPALPAELRALPPGSGAGEAPAQTELALIVQPSLFFTADAGDGRVPAAPVGVELLQTAMFEPDRRWLAVAEFQQLHGGGVLIANGVEPAATTGVSPVREPAQSANLGLEPSAESAKLGPLGCAQTAKLGVPKPPSYIQTGSTNTTTTNPLEHEPCSGADEGCRRRSLDQPEQAVCSEKLEELIFPKQLPTGVLNGLRSALLQAPSAMRQKLLDELQGQLQIPTKTIHNPVAWMLGLIRRCADGAVLALADTVANERRRLVEPRPSCVREVGTSREVVDPELREIHRQRLRTLRQEFGRKAGRP